MPYRFQVRAIHGLFVVLASLIFTPVMSSKATARCDRGELVNFLRNRAFTLSADRKIGLYASKIFRYYDQRNRTRRQVLNAMQDWEDRWPDRIYKFMRIHDFAETTEGDACRVTFDYKFIAYDPSRDKTSAGIGRTTLILAETGNDYAMKIIAEYGSVRCRGLSRFARSHC